ncbi:MAG TPA: trypsin-like serine protease [Polyangiaceae bacterium]|nr:trypsin-like serine protease [Polyangiaceae bacterium]
MRAGLTLASGCSADEDRPTPGAEAAWVGRTANYGAAPVAVLIDHGSELCSAVVVSPRLILTAGHCLLQGSAALRVSFDSPAGAIENDGRLLDARWTRNFDPLTLQDDLVLAVLSHETAFAPISLAHAAPGEHDVLTVVGFGGSPEAPFLRSSGAVMSQRIDPETGLLRLSPAPARVCHGDSGAPIFNARGELVAIVSRGPAECDAEFGATLLTDEHREWLQQFALEVEARAAPGKRCWFDAQCEDGQCVSPVDAPGRRYCAPNCGPTIRCPAPMTCDMTQGRCMLPRPSPGALGSACTEAWDCGVGVCGQPLNSNQTSQCLQPCAGLDLGCPPEQRCVPAQLRGSPSPWTHVCIDR